MGVRAHVAKHPDAGFVADSRMTAACGGAEVGRVLDMRMNRSCWNQIRAGRVRPVAARGDGQVIGIEIFSRLLSLILSRKTVA